MRCCSSGSRRISIKYASDRRPFAYGSGGRSSMKFARVVLFFSVIAGLSLVAMFPATVGQGTALARDASQDGVHVEWLGHMFFRITSPSGLVVLTSPWVQNPDSPVTLDTVGRADIILVPDAHNDDIGQAFEIGVQTGATVIAPRLLGQRLVDQGLDSANVVAAQPGVTSRQGIQIVSVPSLHDNSMRDGDQTLNL